METGVTGQYCHRTVTPVTYAKEFHEDYRHEGEEAETDKF